MITTKSTKAEKSLLTAILKNTGKPMSEDQKWVVTEIAKIRDSASFRLSPSHRGVDCYVRYTFKHEDDTIDVVLRVNVFANGMIEVKSTRAGYRGGYHYTEYDRFFSHWNLQRRFTVKNLGDFPPFLEIFEKNIIQELNSAESKRANEEARKVSKAAKIAERHQILKDSILKQYNMVDSVEISQCFDTLTSLAIPDGKIKKAFTALLPLIK